MKLPSRLLLAAAATLMFLTTPASASIRTGTLGRVVAASTATRTIVIDAKTRNVNVTEHETVRFDTGRAVFAIAFTGTGSSFDLNQLAPAGSLDHEVTVYVAPDPLYLA